MKERRVMQVAATGSESATTTFARDQWMLLCCREDAVARARVWRRDVDGLLLGRFHRADPASCAPEASAPSGLSRRQSGGRVVPVGPAVVCFTLVAPVVDWFDPVAGRLRPDQVLNRGLRPLLAMLRRLGVEAFYPGRDLVTVSGRVLAHASFTVQRDGAVVVEVQLAEGPAFDALPQLLDRLDPASVAGVDRSAFDGATSLMEQAGQVALAAADDEWATRLATSAADAFSCETAVVDGASASGPWGHGHGTPADPSAARDFLLTPGPLEAGALVASTVSMLGVVECSARMRGDRLTGLKLTGDIIAPFHTVEAVGEECEGQPFRPAHVRKALARAMAHPRSFLLGLRELDELILRMA